MGYRTSPYAVDLVVNEDRGKQPCWQTCETDGSSSRLQARFDSTSQPAPCALEIGRALRNIHSELLGLLPPAEDLANTLDPPSALAFGLASLFSFSLGAGGALKLGPLSIHYSPTPSPKSLLQTSAAHSQTLNPSPAASSNLSLTKTPSNPFTGETTTRLSVLVFLTCEPGPEPETLLSSRPLRMLAGTDPSKPSAAAAQLAPNNPSLNRPFINLNTGSSYLNILSTLFLILMLSASASPSGRVVEEEREAAQAARMSSEM